MKIAYDAQIFYEQAYGGVSRYICELAARIAALDEMEVSITAPMHINAYLEHLQHLVAGFRLPGVKRMPLSVRGAGMLMCDLMMRAQAPDLIHETYYFPYRMGPLRARRVLTVHDMIHERLPGYFDPTDRTPRFKLMAVQRADHIICVSKRTRQDLIDVHGTSPDKISVVHHGFGLLPARDGDDAGKPPLVQDSFLLYVGPRGGYKNFAGLLQAYAASREVHERCLLVCFGGGELTQRERETVRGLGLREDRVVQFGGGDQVLARLYRQALAFVYPSLYEGFGIPPLEAMSFGCPVVCSNGGSIPEVVGDAGAYFEAGDVESMRLALQSVASSESARRELIARGLERLKLFSWDRCARETAAVYRKLL
ncbi:glycosyltransferase family 4 protein [Geomonas azotofigens]|uniref:glycosyltransferase family 4 protein n=1 Tax=Geomonas azotofigens TaxID=2843196 RepID=UPI001C0F6AFD|nr:glycosyltransferase family 1 protein [Geomonas azotofigens]MBU5612537.1 glycosyltransferase family 4 protein [Geomonas azotofigens]